MDEEITFLATWEYLLRYYSTICNWAKLDARPSTAVVFSIQVYSFLLFLNFLVLSILFDDPQRAYDICLKLRRLCLQWKKRKT